MSRMRTFQRNLDPEAIARGIHFQDAKDAQDLADYEADKLKFDASLLRVLYCEACEQFYSLNGECECEVFEMEV